ncbi:MAG: ABC transporter permease, partial [Actinobacteria bacterium]|nr:ABC transporter permease [Actinomycetota bacterium]
MSTAAIPTPSLSHRARRWFSRNLIRIYATLAFIYLFIPVAYTFAF